ncbi:hypothetical protein [Nonomuraea gerenzanensis]|uniref:hypothetical protein n=1 Tax=Nonomuraea gerenzanensis TaxID=93944 RepID=UPI001CD991A6|nr:hypothetical protein [Nonomuraea gerenzanensis]UBU08350.1 hypothetical protein LCN96_28550 [Nonomuraea gerenzanensis]
MAAAADHDDFAQQHGASLHLTALQRAPARLLETTRVGERLRLHLTIEIGLATIASTPRLTALVLNGPEARCFVPQEVLGLRLRGVRDNHPSSRT